MVCKVVETVRIKAPIHIPPVKIQGIKTKIVPFIQKSVSLSPDTVWIEPFMGSGVVGFNMEPERAVFSDINPCIIDLYQQIQKGSITPGSVRSFLEEEGGKLSQYDEAYYYKVRERFNRDHSPMDFLFLNRSCFNGMIRFNRQNRFNVPYGHKPNRFSKAYITKIVHQVQHIQSLCARYDWSFLCQPFETAIEHAPDHAFIYCDPPYIGRHTDYYDSWDEADELRLCQYLKTSGAKFMVSTWEYNQYRSNQYVQSVWGFCHKQTVDHFYHVGAREANRAPVKEALLTNYSLSEG